MDTSDSREAGSSMSPRSFAVQHQRPKNSFVGCSRISDYEMLGKLGEGTFGYACTGMPKALACAVLLTWNI